MFVRFRSEYAGRRDDGASGVPWRAAQLMAADGYASFAEEFAGASFAGGLYRVHDEQSGPQALALVVEAFPEFDGRVRPFGYDWLGRQFAIDLGRTDGGQPLVLLLEPGTGEALEIPAAIGGFHDEELIDYPDAALASEFFGSWAAEHSDSIPLARDTCLGYRVPLFLGGGDVVENLELSDIDVYWSICGQLRRGIRGLPSEGGVNLGWPMEPGW